MSLVLKLMTFPALGFNLLASDSSVVPSPYQKWTHGPPTNAEFFPLAVWLQSASRAQQYRQAGFSIYVGLWKGPTEEQLAVLKQAEMRLICHQNEFARGHLDDPAIIGWIHGDEPDNAQSLGGGKGYGPPIPPQKIVEHYWKLGQADPTRPVMLNLGQAVAWDNWIGRGARRNHPEDYPEYVKGCDIASFDIYPVVHDSPEVSGKLWFVARGVERLRKWSGERVVWNCLECTRISNLERKPTPQQVRCEAWMSLIHGSRGLIYFVHQFKPVFREAALLDDPDMLAAVTALNRQITELAPVLNSPTIEGAGRVESENAEAPIAFMGKRHGGSTYLFGVAMREGKTTAKFTVDGFTGENSATVLGEDRKLAVRQGSFSDTFAPWDAHIYQWRQLRK
jgi:hypothetical protein